MKGPVDGVHAASDEGLVINPYSRIEDTIEKKRRNLEKRKIRLQQYEEDLRNGKKLSEEQQEARSRIGEVETQLEFMKDLMKMLTGLQKEYHRSAKQRDEANRKRQMEMERGRLAEFIYYQNIFRILSKEHVAGALVDASEGAPKLTEEEWMQLQDFSTAFNPQLPPFDRADMWLPTCEKSAEMANIVLSSSRDRVVDKLTGAKAKELLEKAAVCDCVQDLKFVLNISSDTEEEQQSEETEMQEEQEEPEPEPVKKDPKVIFVHGEADPSEQLSAGDISETADTEFGFENYVVHAQVVTVVRDPPPPIPLPTEVRSDDTVPQPTVNGTTYNPEVLPNEAVWAPSGENEVKAETASQKTIQENGDRAGDQARRSMRFKRNGRGRGGARPRNALPREVGEQQQQQQQVRPNKGIRDQNAGGRYTGRGGRGSGFRGGAGAYTNRNGGGRAGGGGYGNANGYAYAYDYASSHPHRQAGFNFANDPHT
uniref:Caprin-1 dimerization domain-containing protein n=1 Tax=Parascaris univalens TaxID=6257 RepID=A0A915BGD9_PARUN